MRLFVALEVPEWVRAHANEAVAALRRDDPVLRWSDPATWHVTLAFYGEVPERKLVQLTTRLARVAGRYSAVELAVRGVGTFPRAAARAQVLWLGVAADQGVLHALADSAAAAARHAGIAVGDHRSFHPHLTVARCRRPADLRAAVAALADVDAGTWSAGELHLIRSHLGPRPRHETIAHWPLTGGPGRRRRGVS